MTVRDLPIVAFVVLAGARLSMAQESADIDPYEHDGGIESFHYEADLPEVPSLVEVHVRHGESLYDLARWAGVTIEDLETLNAIDMHSGLKPGQSLEIALTDDELVRFEKRRARAGASRVERYLRRRGGLVEVKVHRVRTGETLWSIARANGRLPMWFLATYNEGRDLDHIAIGDALQVPVVGDAVAAR